MIHDYTSCIASASTTLSLEILSAESGLGSLAEVSFFFRMFPFIRSYDIIKCYQQIHSVGRFVWPSLNLWFEDLEKMERPYVLVRESLSFCNLVSGLIVELLIYIYVDPKLKEEELQELLSSSRYSDNVNVEGMTQEEFNRRCKKVVEAFSKFGLFFKSPIEP